ncbi:tetratricopeptide repeat protein [Salidesulfovibrio brasiliensis]|uniref:tetratricopeptide repeat protein n=1 Tax=Salidesulfovibrio brasiliensis TaxID=221711 RepID=UPI0006D16A2F|nr:tetratricopeptide repeat protein [Salidesulfovibrio brasiliensis]
MSQVSLNVLVDYFSNLEGMVVALSDDKVVQRTLRAAVHKVVGTQRDCLVATASRRTALDTIASFSEKKYPVMAFVEQEINGVSATDYIFTLSKLHPDVKILLLTGEIASDKLAYLHELGVVGVVVKPASINNFVEKMAGAIRPNDRLRELVGSGKEHLVKGELDAAEQAARDILSIKPGSPAGLMLAGDVHLARGDRAKAVEAYLEAHNEAELYIEPLRRLVEAFRGFDDDEVLQYLKKLDFISPLNPERKKEIGEVYFRKDELERAEQYFDSCLEIVGREQPSLLSVFASRIAGSVEKGAPEMATKYLRRSLDARGDRLDRNDLVTFNRLGISLRRQGRWQEAVDEYARAMQIAPDDPGLYYNQALAWHDGNRRAEALAAMRKALELEPALHERSDSVALNVGNVFLHAGSPDRAKPYYEAALSINPGNLSAQNRLGEVRRKLQRPNDS